MRLFHLRLTRRLNLKAFEGKTDSSRLLTNKKNRLITPLARERKKGSSKYAFKVLQHKLVAVRWLRGQSASDWSTFSVGCSNSQLLRHHVMKVPNMPLMYRHWIFFVHQLFIIFHLGIFLQFSSRNSRKNNSIFFMEKHDFTDKSSMYIIYKAEISYI